MNEYKVLVDKYIEAKKDAWAETTLAKERARLNAFDGDIVIKNDGATLYKYLTEERKLKPYTAKTAFVRVSDFIQWCMDEGHLPLSFNNIKLFMKHQAKKFKHVYAPKRVGVSFQDAEAKLLSLEDEAVRAKALQLLYGGLRWEESLTLKDGKIIGKGNKPRDVTFVKDPGQVGYRESYEKFHKHLKKLGLKPHDLRKAYANLILEAGGHIGELMAHMGWSSSATAASYAQANRTAQLTKAIKAKLKETK